MADTTKLSFSIDDYFHTSNIGSIQRAIGNNSYGINATQVPGAVPRNRVTQGYVFFTRPQLNLQADNLRNDRHFYRLLTEDYLSIPRSIRALLDPRICIGYNFKTNSIPPLQAPLIDNELAFIPWLTNNLILYQAGRIAPFQHLPVNLGCLMKFTSKLMVWSITTNNTTSRRVLPISEVVLSSASSITG